MILIALRSTPQSLRFGSSFVVIFSLFGSLLLSCSASRHQTQIETAPKSGANEAQPTPTPGSPWLEAPASRWERDFSGSARDSLAPVPPSDLDAEDIGIKTRVYDLFNRWKLNADLRHDRGTQYAEITGECRGRVELDFALTPEEWRDSEKRRNYYRRLDSLITKVSRQLLEDYGNPLEGLEREFFLRGLKTLAWQESRWQHYLRFKDWFFVIVSGGSYNKLDDWGITQVARSSFDPAKLLNTNFFESKGYCSISSSLYYGFMEYYFCYLEARTHPGNGASLFNKIVGAYNRYSSGYSACYYELSPEENYRAYQIRAMGGFKDNFILQPWLAYTANPNIQKTSSNE